MTAAVYYVGIDPNKDRYFARGVVEGDALNLIDNPQQLHLSKVIGNENSIQYVRQLYEVDYHYSYYVSAGTNVIGGFDLGNTALSENGIWVTAGVVHRVRIEVKGESNYSGRSVSFQVWDYGAGLYSDLTSIALTGDWQSSTLAITPTGNRIFIRIVKATDAADYAWSTRKVMVVEGTMPTAYNTGQASDYYDDVTTYVKSMSWNNGMDGYQQTVSGGARATVVLDNRDGQFYPNDDSAANVAANGDFTSWSSASEPTSWSVLSIVDANNITSEVGSDKLHGQGGTGALNLYATTKVLVGIKQVLPTPNQRYRVRFSIGASSGLGGVRFGLETANGNVTYISRIYTEPGVYTFFFTAASSGLGDNFCITNNRYPCDVTLEFIEIYAVPRYAGLNKETLISTRAYYPSTSEYQLFIMRIDKITPTGGQLAVRDVTLECVDAMQEFNRLEYRPGIVTAGGTIQQEISLMMSQVEILWPYASSYWMLGTSFLGVDTWLFDGLGMYATYGGAGIEIDYAAASASNSEKGISANSFLRDLMAMEIGGRFYVDARTGGFTMAARNYDPTLLSGTALTSDDYDAFSFQYADDVLNEVTIWYKQKRLGEGNVVLWSSFENIAVPGKSSKSVTGRYRDPTNEEIQVSAVSTEAIIRNTDYIISPQPNNRKVQVTADPGGQSVTFTIDNDREIDITVTTLQIRGFPLYALTEENITAQNPQSIYNHNIQKQDYNLPLISDQDTAIAIATGLTTMYGDAIARLDSLSFVLNKNDARYSRAIAGGVRFRYDLTSNVLNDASNYIVVGERWSVQAGGDNTTMVTWILEPVERVAFWYLGEAGRSELGITTIPIY